MALVVCGLYSLLLGLALSGWLLTGGTSPRVPARPAGDHSLREELVAVIVAARNEADNLPLLLSDLEKQSYPSFEVIVVDDHSTDTTFEVATRSNLPNITAIPLYEGEGKKTAITRGISAARGSLILTTDADCRVGPRWIETMIHHYSWNESSMTLGPVGITGRALLGAFQTLDMFGLMLFTCGSARWRRPVLANGANLLFAKPDFAAVGGYGEHMNITSGDDVLLMQQLAKHYGTRSISFVKSRDAIVRTGAQRSLKEFIAQRVRWLSKRSSMNPFAKTFMVSVFLLTVLFVVTLIYMATNTESLTGISLIALSSAAAVTTVVAITMASFFNRLWTLAWFPLVMALYPLYILIMPMVALFARVSWKGRPVKS